MTLHQDKLRILILGGYGIYGKKLSKLLAANPLIHITIAGRHLAKAEALRASLLTEFPQSSIQALGLNWHSEDFLEQLRTINPKLLIHAAGYFQGQDYTVAKACVSLGIHYLDLAEDREFVNRIDVLDREARKQKVVVISGAGLAPGLSSVVIEQLARKFAILREIDFGIAPSMHYEPSAQIWNANFSEIGQPFKRLEQGEWKTVYGWQNIHRHYYGDNIGLRWHGNFNAPDLDLLPKRFAKLQTFICHTGVEHSFTHWLLWNLSWLVRAKIIRNFSNFPDSLQGVSKWLNNKTSGNAGMYVHLMGSDHNYQPLEVNWQLIAEKGHSPYITVAVCLILTNKIVNNQLSFGAQPCVALFTLEEFNKIAASWNIYTTIEETTF